MTNAIRKSRRWQPAAERGHEHGEGPARDYLIAKPAHGQIIGDVWSKRAMRSRHFLRRPPAIAVDLSDLEAAEACGARLLCVRDTESGATYWATLDTIRRHGFTLDRGHGVQVALPLNRWASSKAEAALEGVGR
ncbi:MAG: hypothetical protein H5T69_00265 [Chloroflexi bacterium]|nr:hypothetical protein [Chloroflexota bacterium]